MCSTAIVRDVTAIFVMAGSRRFLSGSGFLDRVCGLADQGLADLRTVSGEVLARSAALLARIWFGFAWFAQA
jgi:hypothetical protein